MKFLAALFALVALVVASRMMRPSVEQSTKWPSARTDFKPPSAGKVPRNATVVAFMKSTRPPACDAAAFGEKVPDECCEGEYVMGMHVEQLYKEHTCMANPAVFTNGRALALYFNCPAQGGNLDIGAVCALKPPGWTGSPTGAAGIWGAHYPIPMGYWTMEGNKYDVNECGCVWRYRTQGPGCYRQMDLQMYEASLGGLRWYLKFDGCDASSPGYWETRHAKKDNKPHAMLMPPMGPLDGVYVSFRDVSALVYLACLMMIFPMTILCSSCIVMRAALRIIQTPSKSVDVPGVGKADAMVCFGLGVLSSVKIVAIVTSSTNFLVLGLLSNMALIYITSKMQPTKATMVPYGIEAAAIVGLLYLWNISYLSPFGP